ncbi:hypothetical protein Tco_0373304 [Tanacetum coccineum]
MRALQDRNLLQGGNLASGMSSLRLTGGDMNSKTGSGGSGDNGNGNDVGTGGGKCSVMGYHMERYYRKIGDDVMQVTAKHLAMRFSEIGL